MDPDTTLTNLLDLFTGDRSPTTEAVREHTEALEQWHNGRGFLPRWPVHLDSGFHFSRVLDTRTPSNAVSERFPRATQHQRDAILQFRSEAIALLTRVQVAIEEESRSLYVAAVSNLGGWAARALDSESPAPFEPQRPLDLVGGDVVCEARRYQCVRVDPTNTAQVVLRRAGDSSDTEWRVHWGLCKLVSEDDPTWHNQPADWRCPTCKTTDANVRGATVTCANGHESQ